MYIYDSNKQMYFYKGDEVMEFPGIKSKEFRKVSKMIFLHDI